MWKNYATNAETKLEKNASSRYSVTQNKGMYYK